MNVAVHLRLMLSTATAKEMFRYGRVNAQSVGQMKQMDVCQHTQTYKLEHAVLEPCSACD